MTPERFKECLKLLHLDYNQASLFFDVAPRNTQRWASGDTDVPRSIGLTLEMMIKAEVTPAWVNEQWPWFEGS